MEICACTCRSPHCERREQNSDYQVLGGRSETSVSPCQHKCWGSAMKPFVWYRGVSPGYCVGSRGCEWYTGAIPLLQTCRLIYTEAVSILYCDNIFRFNHVDTVISLSHTTLPSRFNLIRVLHLAHSFPFSMYGRKSRKVVAPYDAKTWEEVCQVLAKMSGLEELYMHLGEFDTTEIHEVLAPLHQIRQTKIFELFIGLRSDPEKLCTVKDRPFRLVGQQEWGMADQWEEWMCC
ncbi:hypothetical protein P170DRAFT_508945 [Aspergillus steynii IBT 23096]|uniref:DUF7730 domain-containing protein n=1 Tax=Aspergillus steynii IBT 23096 TaxID=1392250 RepID=A0A2I2GDC3_9EURO|nr:uncharacterized protein P170DRAFT_508945 [Aspergillus steynii IBT 23096]PLB50841.1 hypothetical protein P170DRAFT_508945 [Aspergillus steynii IBT 23096]